MNEARGKRSSDMLIDEEKQFGDLEYMTGVIPLEKLMPFELLIWRLSRGNAFVRSDEINPADYDEHSPLIDKQSPTRLSSSFCSKEKQSEVRLKKLSLGEFRKNYAN